MFMKHFYKQGVLKLYVNSLKFYVNSSRGVHSKKISKWFTLNTRPTVLDIFVGYGSTVHNIAFSLEGFCDVFQCWVALQGIKSPTRVQLTMKERAQYHPSKYHLLIHSVENDLLLTRYTKDRKQTRLVQHLCYKEL